MSIAVDAKGTCIWCAFIFLMVSVPLLQRQSVVAGEYAYDASAVVLLAEVVKLFVAQVLAFLESRKYTGFKGVNSVGDSPEEDGISDYEIDNEKSIRAQRPTVSWALWCKFAIPAVSYGVMNNIGFYANLLLSPGVFVLFTNFNLITSAFFSAVILRRGISLGRCLLLSLILTALVVTKEDDISWASKSRTTEIKGDAASVEERSKLETKLILGISLVLIESVISGFAGTVSELLLTSKDVGDFSLWQRNVWLYQWGVATNTLLMIASSRQSKYSVIAGTGNILSPIVFLIIVFSATNGLVISLLLRHFGNVSKCLGKIGGVFITAVVSCILHNDPLSVDFFIGFYIAAASLLLYNLID